MPLRLIDVGSESQAPRLFERPPRDSTGRRAPYACLSYCWGLKPGEEVLKTTTENCDVHKAEIPIKSAPPAIQDAVDLCRGLGIKYLWVDSLCLTQDNLQMWLSEAAEMDSIYLNSHLTIAALEPHTCKLHFLGPQPFGTPDWQYFMQTDTVCDDGQTVDMVIRPEGSNPAKVAATKTTSLDTRAWCFQESLLPNRRLCFDGNEMIWECLCTKICECGHAIRRPPTLRYSVLGAGMKEKMLKGVPLQSGPKPFVYQHEERDFDLGNMNINAKWRRLISDYSSRHMTVPKDRLRAVSGLAKVVLDWFRKDRKTTSAPVEYLAGLWKHELQLDLAWVVTEFRPKPSVREGETPWNVPTWSWASAWGGVMFPGAMTPKWKYTARIRNMCRVEKVDCEKEYQKDETSAVTEGRAKLYGTLVAVKPSREADLGNSREAETFWFGDAGKDPDQARERKWFVRAENGEENGEEVAVMFDEPLSLPSESQSTDHPKKGLPTNDRYYCFRLFAWLADDTRVYRGDGGEITMGPETWFLLLRSSQRVQGAMERVGIGKHESKDGIPCPIFKDAKDEIVEIV
ncbi:heterokaryon incompatibility protein-domain-containing protein [Diplogelasinospora grovesii]|uniref:Heterokaryon incompatibility protein-domain-containing protein n=1 Tax=Diplogelasinospora grovesii TaxID=303347 RepID=A0AAN6S4V8_9PEZI|nr:heterokaryon incompatibility protein-domain-containing protein [Diplogelasinospora grovesii]